MNCLQWHCGHSTPIWARCSIKAVHSQQSTVDSKNGREAASPTFVLLPVDCCPVSLSEGQLITLNCALSASIDSDHLTLDCRLSTVDCSPSSSSCRRYPPLLRRSLPHRPLIRPVDPCRRWARLKLRRRRQEPLAPRAR